MATNSINFQATSNLDSKVAFSSLVTDDSGQNVMGYTSPDTGVVNQVYVSQDYGFTWTQCPLPEVVNGFETAYQGIAISGNGERFFLGTLTPGGYLFTATNPTTASSWNQLLLPEQASTILDIAVNYDGSVIFVSATFSKTANGVTTFAYGAISTDSGATFSLLSALPVECTNIAIDNSGTNLVCAVEADKSNYVLVSTNSGANFTNYVATTADYFGYGFAASYYNQNKYLYMPSSTESSTIIISSDNGITWQSSNLFTDATTVSSRYISTTGNGMSAYLGTTTSLLYSTNGGVDWVQGYSGGINSVAVSNSGANIYISTDTSGFLFYHNDSSLTPSPTGVPTFAPTLAPWTDISLPVATNGYNFIVMSKGATYLVASQTGGHLVGYLTQSQTTDAGSKTGPSSKSHTWTGICMDSEGKYVVAIGDGIPYYFATSYNVSSLTQATVQTTADLQTELTITSCAMTSSGNVTVISQSLTLDNTATNGWLVAIYKKTSNSDPYVPVFVPSSGSTYFTYPTNVGIDETGYVIALADTLDDVLYLTTDGGNSWVKLSNTLFFDSTFFSMSQSSLGAYMIIMGDNAGGKEYSLNQGATWVYMNTFGDKVETIYSIVSCYSGQRVIGSTNEGAYVSNDYGYSWELETAFSVTVGAGNPYATIDPTGQYLAYVDNTESSVHMMNMGMITSAPTLTPTLTPTITSTSVPSKIPTLFPTLLPTRSPVVTSAPSVTPNPIPFTASSNLDSSVTFAVLTTDDNGKNVMGITELVDITQVYVSQDYAFTWTTVPLPTIINSLAAIWGIVAISGNGEVFYAGTNVYDGYLYTSTNPTSAADWIGLTALPTTYTLDGVAVNYEGNAIFVTAMYDTGIVTQPYAYGAISTDSGATFTILTGLSTSACTSLAMDNSGTNLVCAREADTSNYVDVSTDSGATFITYAASVGGSHFAGIGLGASYYNQNKYLFMPSSLDSSYIQVSSNNGALWQPVTLMSDGSNVAATAIAATGNGESVYLGTTGLLLYSNDAGNSWHTGYTGSVVSVAVADSGANIYISTSSGFLAYRNDSTLTPSPTGLPTLAPTFTPWNQINLPESASGYNQVVMSTGGNYVVVSEAAGHLVGVNPQTQALDTGSTSGPSSKSHAWSGICMNSDGKYVVAIGDGIPYYFASSYNVSSLTQATVQTDATDLQTAFTIANCAMTSSGNVTVIGQSNTDSNAIGNTWVVAIYRQASMNQPFQPVFVPSSGSSYGIYASTVGIDATGEIIAFGNGDGYEIYITLNSGTTWNKIISVSYCTSFLTVSQYNVGNGMISICSDAYDKEYSVNQGQTWTNMASIGDKVDNVYSLIGDYTGQRAIIATNAGIFVSSNYGASWVLEYSFPSSALPFTAIATMDPSGQVLAFVDSTSSTLYMFNDVFTPLPSMAPVMSPTMVPTTFPSLSSTVAPTNVANTPTMVPSAFPSITLSPVSSSSSSSSTDLSTGAVAGIAIGVIIGIGLIAALIFFYINGSFMTGGSVSSTTNVSMTRADHFTNNPLNTNLIDQNL